MADEETKQQQTPEEPQEEAKPEAAKEPQAAEQTAPEQEAPEAAAESPAGDQPAAPADDAEQGEAPTSKQLRKLTRATAKRPARDRLTPEQRSDERAKARAERAVARQRWRAKRRAKSTPAGSRPAQTPAAGPGKEPGKRKARRGIVVSNKADKTITVRIDNVQRHRTYGKVLRHTNTLHAHDERNEAGEGDVVRVIECRPLSRSKRWRLVEVLEKAK